MALGGNMKSTTRTRITVIALFAALAEPIGLSRAGQSRRQG